MRFAKINISILQGYATVDFSIVLIKIILVSCVIGIIYPYYAQSSIFCETEYPVFRTISWLKY